MRLSYNESMRLKVSYKVIYSMLILFIARQTQILVKPESISKPTPQDKMRRTGGGFTQFNFFPKGGN